MPRPGMYICWTRLGRGEQAIEAYLQLVHVQQAEAMASDDVCPNLTYLVSKYGCFETVRKKLGELGDLLAYATVTSIQWQRENG